MNLAEEYAAAVKRTAPRPLSWDDVIGNKRAVEQIREAISASKKSGKTTPLPHMLLFGPPGMGKTTMAKIASREFGEFFETTASTLEAPADMIRLLWAANVGREKTGQPSVIFIDEIHQLGAAKGRMAIDQESIFPLLEDWRFPHNMIRKTVTDFDGIERVLLRSDFLVWPFTCVGATTEPGMLSSPLLRRFLLHVELDPYTEAEIAQITIGSAKRLEWPITEGAAAKIAAYGRRTPGTALQLLTSAHSRAIATDRPIVNEDVADEVIERLGLLPLGLTQSDLRVLLALYDRMPRGMGMAELCRATAISVSQFTGLVEPWLRQLNFIETLARRVIRQEGVRYLAEIGKIKIDLSRPEVRAAVGA